MKIDAILDKCKDISTSKRKDYCSSSDTHENFKRSALVASWFKDDQDKPYAVLVATKLARLSTLLSSNRTPNNESIDDSFLDLINYCALWAERRSQMSDAQNELIERQIQEYKKMSNVAGLGMNPNVAAQANPTKSDNGW